MPSSIQTQIFRVPGAAGGPYAYIVTQDGVAQKASVGWVTALAAFNAANTDAAALIPAGETPSRIVSNVLTAP